MGIGRWYPERTNLEQERNWLAALPIGADAGITREQLMELIAAIQNDRSRLALAESQYVEARGRLEAAGLIPPRG